MARYTTFYTINDPKTGEPRFVLTTQTQLQQEIKNVIELAMKSKEKNELFDFIKDLYDNGRRPKVTDLGQFKLNSYEVGEKKKKFEIDLGIANELAVDAIDLAKNAVVDIISGLDKPTEDKPKRKPRKKRATTKSATPKGKK